MAIGGGQRMRGLLGSDFQDPRTQGIMGLASGLLAGGAPQVGKPVSFGSAFSTGLDKGMEEFTKAQKRKEELERLQKEYDYRASRDALADTRYSNELTYDRSRDAISDDFKNRELSLTQTRLDLQKLTQDRALAKTNAEKKQKEMESELKVRKLYTDGSKDFLEARTGFQKVTNAVLNPEKSAANDIALIFGFMKTIDPRSVVREGEFATAQNATGVPSRVMNAYNMALKGTRLNDTQRGEFYDAALKQFKGYSPRQQELVDDISNLSTAYGLNSANIIKNYLPESGSVLNPIVIEPNADLDQFDVGTYVLVNGQLNIIEDN